MAGPYPEPNRQRAEAAILWLLVNQTELWHDGYWLTRMAQESPFEWHCHEVQDALDNLVDTRVLTRGVLDYESHDNHAYNYAIRKVVENDYGT